MSQKSISDLVALVMGLFNIFSDSNNINKDSTVVSEGVEIKGNLICKDGPLYRRQCDW